MQISISISISGMMRGYGGGGAPFSLSADQWTVTEQEAATRRVQLDVFTAPPAGKRFLASRVSISNPSGTPTSGNFAEFTEITPTHFRWQAAGQSPLGSNVYPYDGIDFVKVFMVDASTSAPVAWNATGVTPVSTTKVFDPSGPPLEPSVLETYADGIGGITVTYSAMNDNGRALTSQEYRLDGGDWTSFTGVELVLGGLGGDTTLETRLGNANGYSEINTETLFPFLPGVLTFTLTDAVSASGNRMTTAFTLPDAPIYEEPVRVEGRLDTGSGYGAWATITDGGTVIGTGGTLNTMQARVIWTNGVSIASDPAFAIPTSSSAAFFIDPDAWDGMEDPGATPRLPRATTTPPTVPGGKKLSFYAGSTATGSTVSGALTDMAESGGVYSATAATAAGLGETTYVRIVIRNTDNSGAEWASDEKSFVASNVPVAPSGSAVAVSGGSTVALAPADGRGRDVTATEYNLDGAGWLAFTRPSTTITLADTAVHSLALRDTNVNGVSATTTISVQAAGIISETFTISTPEATPRVGDSLTMTTPSDLGAGNVIGATYLQAQRADMTGEVNWLTRVVTEPADQSPLNSKVVGCRIRVKAAVHDAAGDFVEWRFSNEIGPVMYEVGFLDGATLIALNDVDALRAAVLNTAITKIMLAPGIWNEPFGNTFQSRNRSASPVMICSADPSNRANITSQGIVFGGSRNLTFYGLSVDRNYGSSGTTCFNPGNSIDCRVEGCWSTNGPRWTREQMDSFPTPLNGDTIWAWTLKLAFTKGFSYINNLSEFSTCFVTLSEGVTCNFEGNFHRGWWFDMIVMAGSWPATNAGRPLEDIYFDDFISTEALGIPFEGIGTNPHPDHTQYNSAPIGRARFHRILHHNGINRVNFLYGGHVSHSVIGGGAYESEYCSFNAGHSAPNGMLMSSHKNTRIESSTLTRENPLARGGQIRFNYPNNNRFIEVHGTEFKSVANSIHAMVIEEDGYLPERHEVTKYDLGVGADSNYNWNDAGSTVPFRTLGTGENPSLPLPEDWLQFTRPLPAYADLGGVTSAGYVRPVRTRPAAPANVVATRGTPSTVIGVTWDAVSGAHEYIVRMKRDAAEKYWITPYGRVTGTSHTFADIGAGGFQRLIVEVIAVSDLGIRSAPTSVTIAGIDTAPSVSVTVRQDETAELGNGSGVFYKAYDVRLEPLGWPEPAAAVFTTITFDGVVYPLVNGGALTTAATTQLSKVASYVAMYRLWANTTGRLILEGTISNGIGSPAPFSLNYLVTGAPPTTIVAATAGPTATDGEISVVVSTTSYDPDADQELCLQLDSRPPIVVASPPAAGTYIIDGDDGVIPGVQQAVRVFVRNLSGNGPFTVLSATSAGGAETLVYSDRFITPRTPQSDMTASQQIQTITPINGTSWDKREGGTNSFLAMHATLRGVRLVADTGTQRAVYSLGSALSSASQYGEAEFDMATVNQSALNGRLLLRMSDDGLRWIAASIGNTSVSISYFDGTSITTLGSAYSHGFTAGSIHTVRLEVRPNDQRLILNGTLRCSASVADVDMSGLGLRCGLLNSQSSGQNQAGPGGVLWREVAFGTL